jgi:hypothetical protein
MPEYCPTCGAELEAIPTVPDFGLPLSEVFDETQATLPAAEVRVRRALEYMAEKGHQPGKSTWARIHFETIGKLLRGEQEAW